VIFKKIDFFQKLNYYYLFFCTKNISESVSINKDIFTIDYRYSSKLNKFIKAQKDSNQLSSNNNAVYKILCKKL